MSERPKGSVSQSALDIQRELAKEEGFVAGRAALHNSLSAFIQTEREKGNESVTFTLLERLLALWTSS